MIDTNQLLSIAFTLIANFTSVVKVPPDCVPQRAEDLKKIVIGSPQSPLDLWLVHKRGHEFWISGGIVRQYESPDSYFHLQNWGARERLKGAPTISSNQAMELAANLLRSVEKYKNPTAGVRPIIKATKYADIPFYEINWPDAKLNTYNGLATVEIDARTGRAVFVQLWSSDYYDLSLAAEISNRVYTPEPPSNRKPFARASTGLKPTTNEVQELLPKWLNFCQTFGMDPGSQTNVEDVDWESSFNAKSPRSFPTGRLLSVQFRNGACFQSVNGVIFDHTCADASFVAAWAERPPDYWKKFVGTPTFKWEDLARQLNILILRKTAISKAYLDQFKPKLYTMGSGGVTRCVVCWYEKKNIGKVAPDSLKTASWQSSILEQVKSKTFSF